MRIWAGRRVSPRRRTLWDKLLSRHNWRGLAGMLRTADAPLAVMFRYYLKVGNYPYTIGLYTPLGPVAITLYDWEDLVTVHEVFFREDYAIGRGVRTIVDFGSNIGVSAIYFLTRNPGVKVYAYEPVPRNKCRLERNLAPFAGRVELIDCAVGTEEGTVTFGIERSGRYGGILRQDEADAGRRPFEAYIQVPCRYAERELARIRRPAQFPLPAGIVDRPLHRPAPVTPRASAELRGASHADVTWAKRLNCSPCQVRLFLPDWTDKAAAPWGKTQAKDIVSVPSRIACKSTIHAPIGGLSWTPEPAASSTKRNPRVHTKESGKNKWQSFSRRSMAPSFTARTSLSRDTPFSCCTLAKPSPLSSGRWWIRFAGCSRNWASPPSPRRKFPEPEISSARLSISFVAAALASRFIPTKRRRKPSAIFSLKSG